MSSANPSRHDPRDDGLGGLVRRVLSSGPTPEERLEELLAERRRELDEAAMRFDASIADLERREELLRDSRASVERMLRLGRSDLEARENELTDFLRELTEREARMAEAEAEIARRRQDLGAVELKRAAVERRERDVAARESLLADLEVEAEQRAAREAPGEPRAEHVELAFVSGPSYRLVERPAGDLVPGATVEIDAEEYVVERIGPSPLPGDRRRCAFVVRSALRRGSDGPS